MELERILKTFRGEAAPVSEDVRCNHKEAPLMCDCPRSREIQELSKLGLHVKDLQSLFVFDRDGRKVIFCDKGISSYDCPIKGLFFYFITLKL